MRVKLNTTGYTKIYNDGSKCAMLGDYTTDDEVVAWLLDINNIIEPEFTVAELTSQQLMLLESMIDPHIMKPITDYNLANGVRFASPQNCKDWTDDTSYEHYAFCVSAWNYHKNVYKTARSFQISQSALGVMPTVVEFQTVLDSVVF